ncbi:MAG: response regulator transcription factor [Planctomycetota bacterium]|nr:response regulator transcription factor [Planctomycetota bacterium]
MRERRILVVEDEPDLAELARLHLEDAGFVVDVCHDGAEALERHTPAEPFDLVVLDLMLPGLDGLEVCRRIRSAEDYTPVLILTAKGTELDRVLGLELGADDYMTKPASPRELVARVRAIFRMRDSLMKDRDGEHGSGETKLERGDLVIDTARHRVSVAGAPLELTVKEFELLRFLAETPGRVHRRDDLVEGVWGLGYEGYEHTVNSHINRLRKKLSTVGQGDCIETVWGVGYRFREESKA